MPEIRISSTKLTTISGSPDCVPQKTGPRNGEFAEGSQNGAWGRVKTNRSPAPPRSAVRGGDFLRGPACPEANNKHGMARLDEIGQRCYFGSKCIYTQGVVALYCALSTLSTGPVLGDPPRSPLTADHTLDGLGLRFLTQDEERWGC